MGEITNLPISTKRITELDANTSVEDSDLFVTVNGGVDKNITGEVIKDTMVAIAESIQDIIPSITGTATFTNLTNNINLAGISSILDLEVGDVIQIKDTTSNNSEFTLSSIVDSNNIIVNEDHGGGSTTKSLIDETSSCTITLLAKWHSAALGIGQGKVYAGASILDSVTYTNTKGRAFELSVRARNPGTYNILGDGIGATAIAHTTGNSSYISSVIPRGSSFSVKTTGASDVWIIA